MARHYVTSRSCSSERESVAPVEDVLFPARMGYGPIIRSVIKKTVTKRLTQGRKGYHSHLGYLGNERGVANWLRGGYPEGCEATGGNLEPRAPSGLALRHGNIQG